MSRPSGELRSMRSRRNATMGAGTPSAMACGSNSVSHSWRTRSARRAGPAFASSASIARAAAARSPRRPPGPEPSKVSERIRPVVAVVVGARCLVLAAHVDRDHQAACRGQRLEHGEEVFLAAGVAGNEQRGLALAHSAAGHCLKGRGDTAAGRDGDSTDPVRQVESPWCAHGLAPYPAWRGISRPKGADLLRAYWALPPATLGLRPRRPRRRGPGLAGLAWPPGLA